MDYELNTDMHTSGYVGLALHIAAKVIITTLVFIIGHVALVYVLGIALGVIAVSAAVGSTSNAPYYPRRRSSTLTDIAIIGSGAYVGYKAGRKRRKTGQHTAHHLPPRK